MANLESPTFIGFDFSTQQLKAIVIDDDLQVICEESVSFDHELPEFRTSGGVNSDGLVVTAPPIMWVKALDMLVDKLKVAGVDFHRVAAISGAGQQHGSVYWRLGAERTLTALSPDQFLHSQLDSCFSVRCSPVWMDSSTGPQCRALEQYIGGAQKLADITGSRAYERFTGSQIAKIYQNSAEIYKNTERISLVSSFACSLFLCRYAAIDLSDASGMNLLDIGTHNWHQDCLDGCAPGLGVRLGAPVRPASVLGPVGDYWSARHGFRPDCRVVSFSGDNPASLAGLRLGCGDLAVSLGTSDTLFAVVDRPTPGPNGHLFVSPTRPDACMALLCFKNGSLTRERVRDAAADGCWQRFDQLLGSTPPGNQGNMGVYWDETEITPCGGRGRYRRTGSNDTDNTDAPPQFDGCTEVRALIESQFMAKRVHAEQLGFAVGSETRVLATGGASRNTSVLQVLSDVFNASVYTHDVVNSACLGSAYLARYGVMRDDGNDDHCTFEQTTAAAQPFRLACRPAADAQQIYAPLLVKYSELEEEVMSNANN